MSFALRATESLEQGLRRIASEQIEKAMAELDDPDLDVHVVVHQVRKRCKKIRALLRLVRAPLGRRYRFENDWYRDLARDLAWLRDAQSNLDAWCNFSEVCEPELDHAVAARVEACLRARRDGAADSTRLAASLQAARQRFQEGRARIESWSLTADGWKGIKDGALRTYKRGRNAMVEAYAQPDGEHFHEWRKRVKYHGYHLRLLQPLYPPLIKTQRGTAEKLGSLLGEEHDLAQLRALLPSLPDSTLEAQAAAQVRKILDRRREALRSAAARRGALLFAEKPKCLRQRMRRYWRAFVRHES